MQPEDKRCSKLETHTFFLSFFQDGVVLVSGPRNSLCAWTSILACFYSLPKHLGLDTFYFLTLFFLLKMPSHAYGVPPHPSTDAS